MAFGDPIGDFMQAQAQAKAANEQRYQQILNAMQQQLANAAAQQAALQRTVVGGYKKRMSDVLGGIANLGASQRNDLNQQYARASSQGLQNLVSRGLGNSTVLAALQRGYQADASKASTQLNDTLSREQAGYKTQLSGDLLNAQQGLGTQGINLRNALQNQINDFMAARTDAYPDPNFYLALANMAGRGGAGGPTGGGGGGLMSSGGMPRTSNPFGSDGGSPSGSFYGGGGGGYGSGVGVGDPAYAYTSDYGSTADAVMGVLSSLYNSPILSSSSDMNSPFLGAGAGASASMNYGNPYGYSGAYNPGYGSSNYYYGSSAGIGSDVAGGGGALAGAAGGFGSLGE